MAPTPPPNPRKQSSGTSLVATGAVPIPPASLAEMGSANTAVIRDPVPALGSLTAQLKTYHTMANNDVAVDVSLRAAKIPIIGADFFVDPATEAPEDAMIAAFVQYNLLEGLSQPFLQVINDILTMFENGFSIVEPVFENREWVNPVKGANRRVYTMLKKLAPRPATTIKEFKYDAQGGPVSIVQNALDEKGKTKEVDIPIDKLVIFTLDKKGSDLTGRSILRPAYRNWYYKDTLYKIDAIQKERHGIGVPYVSLPPGANADETAAALELVQSIRTNEKAGFVIPAGFDMGFKKPEGELVNVMTSIEHHNGMIMMNIMVQFLLMGLQESGGGGRATSSTHQALYEKSLKYIASLICEFVNLHIVTKLVAYNFPTDRFPKLKARSLGEGKEIQMWASAMANLISQGAITVDTEMENWIRDRLDAPALKGERLQILSANGQPMADSAGNAKGSVRTNDPKQGQGNVGAK